MVCRMATETETTLSTWRHGQTQAERLCADILGVEGYLNVNPQCPLGGPDGQKDILCLKGTVPHVAACFFPPTHQSDADVRAKFLSDAKGARHHGRPGFTFLTNQFISPSQRERLYKLAISNGYSDVEIFHLERLRVILDKPVSMGLRSEYLRIEPSKGEMIGFFSGFKDLVKLREEPRLDEIRHLDVATKNSAETMDVADFGTRTSRDPIRSAATALTLAPWSITASPPAESRVLSVPSSAMIRDLHRWILQGAATNSSFRDKHVYIADGSSEHPQIVYEPPAPESVPGLMNGLLAWWSEAAAEIPGSDRGKALESIVRFHHGMLSIHPFMDGNGRLASYLLELHLLEAFNSKPLGKILGGADYVDALAAAHAGDVEPLVKIISKRL